MTFASTHFYHRNKAIGVSIGDVEWSATSSCDGVKREAVEKAVARVMGGEEGDEMRRRAKVLKEKARTAVEEGGSSHSNLNAFIHDIKTFKSDSEKKVAKND
ncbi:hypothetical protein LXL04_004624 [Taraxacum kok-saghyz]